MTRPGDRLRRLAMRCCSERMRRRLIDPAVADLQAEASDARRAGSALTVARTVAAGYVSIVKVLIIAVVGDFHDAASTWEPAERAGATGGLLVSMVATVVATILFLPMSGPTDDRTWLALYLAPSTLPVTMPLGLLLGVAWTFHGAARTRKLAIAALAFAALCSVGMFVNLGWVVPDANQAFRELRFAQSDPPPRGFNELTWSGMRARLQEARAFESPSEVRALEAMYHRKLAFTVTALPMVAMMLGLAFRRRWGRRRLIAAAVSTFAAHLLLNLSIDFFGPRFGASPMLIGWAATALCAVVAVLITSTRSPRPA